MRLADKIVEQARIGTMPMRQDWQVWAAKLQQADCYIVDPEAGQLSFGTTETSPLRAAKRARPGASFRAPLTWLEWKGPSASMGPRAHVPPRSGSVMPLRSGVLVETKDAGHRYGVMSWMYEMPNGALEPTPLSMMFDWRDEPEEMPDLNRLMFQITGRSWEQCVAENRHKLRADEFEIGDILSEERRWGAVPCMNLPTFWTSLAPVAMLDPTFARSLFMNAFDDLKGEPVFMMGLVICMCAEGLLDIAEPDDLVRLNAARRKRGRTELLPSRRVSVSGRNVIRLSDRGGPLESMQGFHAA